MTFDDDTYTQTDEMSEFSCKTVEDSFNGSSSEKQMATAIRNAFNEAHGPVWNVIVGRHFGTSVTHATKKYINAQIGHLSVLIWKSN
mmetsp:Transcript_10320/g.16644  ORF Transcript_10320/g.16644 Transcript_10320/m.16644 type:complete len:87 (+) Transcript_10320:79-339(+)